MSLQFESLQQEKEFDHAVSEWIRLHRYPGTAALALVMQRAHANLEAAGLPASVSAIERAYRELHYEKIIGLVTEPLAVSPADLEKTLTKEQYVALPANQVARDYLNNKGGWFRAAVDELVRSKQI